MFTKLFIILNKLKVLPKVKVFKLKIFSRNRLLIKSKNIEIASEVAKSFRLNLHKTLK